MSKDERVASEGLKAFARSSRDVNGPRPVEVSAPLVPLRFSLLEEGRDPLYGLLGLTVEGYRLSRIAQCSLEGSSPPLQPLGDILRRGAFRPFGFLSKRSEGSARELIEARSGNAVKRCGMETWPSEPTTT